MRRPHPALFVSVRACLCESWEKSIKARRMGTTFPKKACREACNCCCGQRHRSRCFPSISRPDAQRPGVSHRRLCHLPSRWRVRTPKHLWPPTWSSCKGDLMRRLPRPSGRLPPPRPTLIPKYRRVHSCECSARGKTRTPQVARAVSVRACRRGSSSKPCTSCSRPPLRRSRVRTSAWPRRRRAAKWKAWTRAAHGRRSAPTARHGWC